MRRSIGHHLLLAYAAVVVCLPCAHRLGAQALPDSLAGHRVRVFLARQPLRIEGNAPGQELRGTVVAVAPDTLTLRLHPSAAPLALATSGIRRIEFSHGARSRLEGAVRAGAYGAVLFSLCWVSLDLEARNSPFEQTWQTGAAGLAVGGVLGAVFGAIMPLERWEKVNWR